MNRLFQTGLCLLAFAGLTHTQARAAADATAPLAKKFKVEWTTVRYQKSVSVKNPDIEENQSNPAERNESLSLACQVHVLKPENILGICSTPTVLEISPNTIAVKRSASRSRLRMRYDPLRYETRFQRPESPSKVRTAMRSLLHLPQEPTPPPELVTTLEPSQMQIELGTTALESGVQEIDSLEGNFHVLVAESITEVEIPFEPNENWVPITDDLEILIEEAQSSTSSYRYRIETRNPNQSRNMRRPDISVGNALPKHILIERQLLAEDGEPIHRHRTHSLPANAGGSGSGGGGSRGGGKGMVTRIRYRIGVNPQHRELPFTLKRIPLPKP